MVMTNHHGPMRVAKDNLSSHIDKMIDKEEFEKLPKIIQDIVGSPNVLKQWSQTDVKVLKDISESFMWSYKNELSKQKEIRRMPNEARVLIEKNTVMGIEEK